MITPNPRLKPIAAVIGGVVAMVLGALAMAQGPALAQTSSTTSSSMAPTTSTTEPATTTTYYPPPTDPPTTTTTSIYRTTTTARPGTTTTTSKSSTTTTTSRSSTTTTMASTTTTSGSGGSSSGGSGFFGTGAKVAIVVGLLIAMAIAMGVLTYLYWKRTRPAGGDGSTTSPTPDPSAPVGPLDPMLAEALRPEPPSSPSP